MPFLDIINGYDTIQYYMPTITRKSNGNLDRLILPICDQLPIILIILWK